MIGAQLCPKVWWNVFILAWVIVSNDFSNVVTSLRLVPPKTPGSSTHYSSYLDELNVFKAEKKVLVGLTTDSWQIGQKAYKQLQPVYQLSEIMQEANVACVEVPMWEVAQGPHYDDMQRLLETFWIPDFTSVEAMVLQYDLTIIPDPVLAKYLVEAYNENRAKIAKKTGYYNKLMEQSWGVIESYPPRDQYEHERIKQVSRERWQRKFPPLAVLGLPTYRTISQHSPVEYYSRGVEDFALYLPEDLVPKRRVLVLRYKNRFDTLVQSLVMKDINVTSAYPVTWMRKDWNAQEERIAKEVDVVYFHETHNAQEWYTRMGSREKEPVTVCHDIAVANEAKRLGFKDIFYAKEYSELGLMKAIMSGVEFAKSPDRQLSQQSQQKR